MNNPIILKIRKRTQSGWLLLLLLLLPFCFGILNELLHLPWAIRYLLDVAWIVLLGMMILRRAYTGNWSTGVLGIWVLLFLIYTALSYVLQYQSPLYYLWGVRNNFRFYAAFFAFTAFLTEKDISGSLKIFDRLFWLNAVVSLIQFFLLGLDGDHLGGIFGTKTGGNAYTNVFFLIVVTRSVLLYLNKKENALPCLSKCAVALLVAALAELKFFFVEFVLVLILAVLLTDFTWRKVWIILGGLAAVSAGVMLLTMLFPSFIGWFSLQWFLENAITSKGYTSSGDLNRLNAIPQINALWLVTSGQRIFGLGMGNCETSSFFFLNTPFFEKYGHMHYSWLSYAFMYLECGWIGLVFYWGFFALLFFRVRKMKKIAGAEGKIYCQLAEIMAILCVVISVYNSSLRTEVGYMAYFVLAIPFVLQKAAKRAEYQKRNYGGKRLCRFRE